MRKSILDKFRGEKDRMTVEKRTLVLTHFPRFLGMLEEEVFGPNSPIWDPDFAQIHSIANAGSPQSQPPSASHPLAAAPSPPTELKLVKPLTPSRSPKLEVKLDLDGDEKPGVADTPLTSTAIAGMLCAVKPMPELSVDISGQDSENGPAEAADADTSDIFGATLVAGTK